MITAVDTNVLIDVFAGDRRFGPSSRAALDRCLGDGALLACDVVWSETVAAFGSPGEATEALGVLRVRFSALSADAAAAAGAAWRHYRRTGGPRTRVVADFLVGSHAANHAGRLLTRDRGFYSRYFGDLLVLDPTAP